MKLTSNLINAIVIVLAGFSASAFAIYEGTYLIKGVQSGLCLNVLDQGLHNGANVVIADRACRLNSSKWEMHRRPDGFYNIKARHSDKCLNVLNASQRNGGNVVQATDCNRFNSHWKKISLGGGVYRFDARHSGQCLNVLNQGRSNGTNVVQAERACSLSSSKWTLTRVR